MKKILLTLGTTAVIATPLATVVACGESTTKAFVPSFDENAKELIVAKTTYVDKSEITSTTPETSVKSFLNNLSSVLSNSEYDTSEKIKLTKNDEEDKNEIISIPDITFDPGTTSTNVNVANLAEVKALTWQAVENASINGKIMDLTASENMTWQLFSKAKTTIVGEGEDDSSILSELNKLNIASTRTLEELIPIAGTPVTTEEEADTNFGIVKDQFDSIITALGGTSSDWKFVNIDFDTTSSKFKLTYKHLNESNNRKIDLATTTIFSDRLIVEELSKLNINTKKIITELNEAADNNEIAYTEEEADTKFGISKFEYDKIINTLGDNWNFVNISFDKEEVKFKIMYVHKNEQHNRSFNLSITYSAKSNDIKNALLALSLKSTITEEEALNASTQIVNSEGAIPALGLDKNEVDKILNAITSNGKTIGSLINIRYTGFNNQKKLEIIVQLDYWSDFLYIMRVPITFS